MLIAQRPTLTEEVVDDYRSRFVIEPLEPGFGYTLGNSLRRTLLSSIPGASVTSIRVDGVLHEFTTVPGVKEDLTDIILNIKGLVVLARDHQVLDVQDDLDDVLLDTGDGVELVLDAIESDARDRRARDGRQQGATHRVAERVAEAGLEGLDHERGTELGDALLGERGTLCNEHWCFPFG